MKRFFFALVLLATCTFADAQDKLFTLLPPEQTGVAFRNLVEDQVGLNVVSYEYYYNGGGVAVGDINNDGLPDLYFTSNVMECKLYLNQGDLKFKDITTAAGANGGGGYSTGVVMLDINNDGWQDIYLCKSVDKNPDKRANVLLINNKNNTFTDRAKEYGVDDKGFSMHASFNDMDQDGDLDLLVLNHPYNLSFARDIRLAYNKNKELEVVKDPPTVFESNRYYRNDNGKFTDITKAARNTFFWP
jgi:enediyne biosynthesis protein E4